jgi:hypothetical protein
MISTLNCVSSLGSFGSYHLVLRATREERRAPLLRGGHHTKAEDATGERHTFGGAE